MFNMVKPIVGLKSTGRGSPETCWTGFESRTKLGAAPNTSAGKKKINTRESTTTTTTRTLTAIHAADKGRENMSKVPRRESPWGMPEGDNREPKAHRCNDRAEDVIQVLVLWLVLRVTRLRQFLDLSSSFGNACALNLGMFWFRFGVSLSVLSTSFHDFSRLRLEPLIVVVVVRARDRLCGYAGRNQQRRTPTCKLIPQGERCNLSKNSFFHCIREISI
ncbi:hypothetical protein POTOM_057357 [Populus tomentosa]|uniref:Uncharacterized protein n=1 Tax=Populus tomentosa TaxID=118781 RepID=A0A8X7XZJ1_POPTO|nr:hypothetical protein POTOM_057357 [Populus tomentosa]